jgi:large subunit ribosomal protein L30
MMADLKITQIKSPIGGTETQRATLKSLGLRRIRATVVRPDNDAVRGMIRTVHHLVTVEEVN